MGTIKPKFMYDEEGKKIGAVFKEQEFEKCVDILEDYKDYHTIKERSKKKEKLIPLKEAMKKIRKGIKR